LENNRISYIHDEYGHLHIYDATELESLKKAYFKLIYDHVDVFHFSPNGRIKCEEIDYTWDDIPNLPVSLRFGAEKKLKRKEDQDNSPKVLKEYLDGIWERINAAETEEDLKPIEKEMKEKWEIRLEIEIAIAEQL